MGPFGPGSPDAATPSPVVAEGGPTIFLSSGPSFAATLTASFRKEMWDEEDGDVGAGGLVRRIGPDGSANIGRRVRRQTGSGLRRDHLRRCEAGNGEERFWQRRGTELDPAGEERIPGVHRYRRQRDLQDDARRQGFRARRSCWVHRIRSLERGR